MFQEEIILKYDLVEENLSYVIFSHFSVVQLSVIIFQVICVDQFWLS